MQLELVRHAYTSQFTLGQMRVEDAPATFPLIWTIERPWIPNPEGPGGMPSVSCVPDGLYSVVAHDSQKHPNTYQLWADYLGVYGDVRPPGQAWGRTEILIHKGNFVADVIGCIAVGLEQSFAQGVASVLRSGDAMARIVELLGRGSDVHRLRIKPTAGTTP